MTITVEILRFNPETGAEPAFQSFSVEADPANRVLDLLMDIKRNQDGSLGFRKSCAHGVCGSDAMIINGKEGLACKTLVKDALPEGGSVIKVEPLKHFSPQKDLMVDPKVFFEKYRSISPFLIPAAKPPESKEYIQSREERKKFDDPTKCILCSACYSACPVLDTRSGFIGPAASAQAARFNKDTRDIGVGARLAVLDTENGVWSCDNHFECTRVCPREIKITKLINETKREIKRYKDEKGIE